jgi:single-stranded DNA-binding protein
VVWNKPAEFVATLDTGDQLFVTGQLVDDNFETTKGDSATMTRGRLKIDNCRVSLLRRKGERKAPPSEGQSVESPSENTLPEVSND